MFDWWRKDYQSVQKDAAERLGRLRVFNFLASTPPFRRAKDGVWMDGGRTYLRSNGVQGGGGRR